jgi:putative phosphoesterase
VRIVVFSDTHGETWNFESAIELQKHAEYFIFLGDGLRTAEDVIALYPDKKFLIVAGNCDFGSTHPTESEIVLGGKRIFYTHGHEYQVKYGLSNVIYEAKRRGADILLFGHTHVAFTSYDDGLYIMNPGSLGHPNEGKPSFGVIDINDGSIFLNVVEV